MLDLIVEPVHAHSLFRLFVLFVKAVDVGLDDGRILHLKADIVFELDLRGYLGGWRGGGDRGYNGANLLGAQDGANEAVVLFFFRRGALLRGRRRLWSHWANKRIVSSGETSLHRDEEGATRLPFCEHLGQLTQKGIL